MVLKLYHSACMYLNTRFSLKMNDSEMTGYISFGCCFRTTCLACIVLFAVLCLQVKQVGRTIKPPAKEALQGRSNHGSGRIDATGTGANTDCDRLSRCRCFIYKDKTVMTSYFFIVGILKPVKRNIFTGTVLDLWSIYDVCTYKAGMWAYTFDSLL